MKRLVNISGIDRLQLIYELCAHQATGRYAWPNLLEPKSEYNILMQKQDGGVLVQKICNITVQKTAGNQNPGDISLNIFIPNNSNKVDPKWYDARYGEGAMQEAVDWIRHCARYDTKTNVNNIDTLLLIREICGTALKRCKLVPMPSGREYSIKITQEDNGISVSSISVMMPDPTKTYDHLNAIMPINVHLSGSNFCYNHITDCADYNRQNGADAMKTILDHLNKTWHSHIDDNHIDWWNDAGDYVTRDTIYYVAPDSLWFTTIMGGGAS